MGKIFEQVFARQVEGITVDELLDGLRGLVREGHRHEVKSYNGRDERWKELICRPASAFLNSNGGVIIFGVNNDYTRVTPVPPEITHQKLISVLNSNIMPFSTRIQAKEINVESGNIWVIEIEESDNKPHMLCINNDNSYYVRLDESTRKADHWLVRALFESKKSCKLNIKVTSSDFTTNRSPGQDGITFFLNLGIIVSNETLNVVARKLTIFCFIFDDLSSFETTWQSDFNFESDVLAFRVFNHIPVHSGHAFNSRLRLRMPNQVISEGARLLIRCGSENSILFESYLNIVITEDPATELGFSHVSNQSETGEAQPIIFGTRNGTSL